MSSHATAPADADRSVLGSGLTLPQYAAVVVFSVTLFVVWGGLLWEAPRNASHVGRFFVSYAAVIPVAALLLLALHRFSWAHLITTTGTTWAIKLVLTSALYFGFARGAEANYQAASHVPTAMAVGNADYEAFPGVFPSAAVHGEVPLGVGERALVRVVLPAAGRGLPASTNVTLTVKNAEYAEPLQLVRVDDVLTVQSADAVLHTAHLYLGERSVGNTPVPASSTQHLRVEEPGIYELRCDNHPGENTTLVIVDHPYAAWVEPSGRFRLDGIAVGKVELELVRVRDRRLETSRVAVELQPGEDRAVALSE